MLSGALAAGMFVFLLLVIIAGLLNPGELDNKEVERKK